MTEMIYKYVIVRQSFNQGQVVYNDILMYWFARSAFTSDSEGAHEFDTLNEATVELVHALKHEQKDERLEIWCRGIGYSGEVEHQDEVAERHDLAQEAQMVRWIRTRLARGFGCCVRKRKASGVPPGVGYVHEPRFVTDGDHLLVAVRWDCGGTEWTDVAELEAVR